MGGVVRVLGRVCCRERLRLLLLCFCSLGGMFLDQVQDPPVESSVRCNTVTPSESVAITVRQRHNSY